MTPFLALFRFDLSRCRKWLPIWWLYCVLPGITILGVWQDLSIDLIELAGHVQMGALVMFAILIGLLFQTGHMTRRYDYFQSRPIPLLSFFQARAVFVGIFLMFPYYVGLLVPLLAIEPTLNSVSAFTVYFWIRYAWILLFFSVLASFGKRMSGYLLRVGLFYVLGGVANEFFHQLTWSETFQIFVKAPSVSKWQLNAFLFLMASIVCCWALYRNYIGKRGLGWVYIAVPFGIMLEFAASSIRFLPGGPGSVHSFEKTNPSNLSIAVESAENGRVLGGRTYMTQLNDKTGRSVYGQPWPPYWASDEERYWFIHVPVVLNGIPDNMGFSLKLLEAQWISENGERLSLNRPSGTSRIDNQKYRPLSPGVPYFRLDELLGESPQQVYGRKYSKHRRAYIFGARTSDYEAYKTTPGRLETRLRLDLFSYQIGIEFGLDQVGRSHRLHGLTKLSHASFSAEELQVELVGLSSGIRWTPSPLNGNWILQNQETGRREYRNHSGSGRNQSLFHVAAVQQSSKTFEARFLDDEDIDLSDLDALHYVRIDPEYLGSIEIDLEIEDFRLVTEQSIQEGREHDERTHKK
jgi:hypothetical protein